MSDRAPVVVIGVGNPMRRDDGIGPAAIDALVPDLGDDADLVATDGEAGRLLDLWTDRCLAVVIDAVVSGAPAGTVRRLQADEDPLPGWEPGASSHAVGLAEALAMGRVLERLPRRLVVYGVEPADLETGPGLSPSVADALPGLVEQVRREVTAPGLADSR